MGAYIENESSIIEGVTDCLAFDNGKVIEVWDTDAEQHYGNLPQGWTVEQINTVMRFYDNGYGAGHRDGRAEAQAKIRAALGIIP